MFEIIPNVLAHDIVSGCLTVNPHERITTEDILRHPWITQVSEKKQEKFDDQHMQQLIKFNIKRKFQKTISSIVLAVRVHRAISHLVSSANHKKRSKGISLSNASKRFTTTTNNKILPIIPTELSDQRKESVFNPVAIPEIDNDIFTGRARTHSQFKRSMKASAKRSQQFLPRDSRAIEDF